MRVESKGEIKEQEEREEGAQQKLVGRRPALDQVQCTIFERQNEYATTIIVLLFFFITVL